MCSPKMRGTRIVELWGRGPTSWHRRTRAVPRAIAPFADETYAAKMTTAQRVPASTALRFAVFLSALASTCLSTTSQLHNDSISAKSITNSEPRRLRRYFQSPANDLSPPLTQSMLAFGSIYRFEQLRGEGVLLSSRIVLTHIFCLFDSLDEASHNHNPQNRARAPFDLSFFFNGNFYGISDYRFENPYVILRLQENQPLMNPPATYAFPS